MSLLTLALGVSSFSCAKVADPLPPVATVPDPVQDLRWHQVGEQLRLTFDAPPPEIREIEIHRHCGPAPATAAGLSLLERAERAHLVPETDSRLVYDAPRVDDDTACSYAIRLIRADGRRSPFSEMVRAEMHPVARPPSELRTRVRNDRVVVAWEPPDSNVDGTVPPRIEGFLVNSTHFVTDPFYEITDDEPDQALWIRVQTVSRRADPQVFSRPSPSLRVRPSELLPPSAPYNLTLFALEGQLQLVWDTVPEPDVEGYYVYRGERPDRLERVSPLLRRNRYTDPEVPEDRNYYYYVTAVDRAGNESSPSEIRVSGPFPDS